MGKSQAGGAATLKDVARLAKVHPATVSRALDPAKADLVHPDTRERIVRVANDVGYRINAFAQSLRKNVSGMVGVVVADVANPFLPPVLRGIEQVLRAEGRLLLIAETHDDSATLASILEHLVTRRVDAIILSAAHRDDADVVRAILPLIPVVLAVRSLESDAFPTVTHDDVLGGKLAARHLVELGHQSLAQLAGPADISSFNGRSTGFGSVMATTSARDVSVEDYAAEPTVAEGYRLTRQLLDRGTDRPTALFAHNDQLAVGALDALREHGLRCPEDVSIVGYNDAPLTDHLDPPLTTVRLPGIDLGRRAAELALQQIAGDAAGTQIERFPPELVVRRSTAPPATG
ncbi:LacI family DNA-binding transcriptional regulator [Cryptosporangium sp. NPDC048952]|uniref:LacI family DNA-binding transcriptional regulator n=1 Tax=Cryptosporangium sp. NPDC048952 TaxID=3363961 RepID=UPI00371624D6